MSSRLMSHIHTSDVAKRGGSVDWVIQRAGILGHSRLSDLHANDAYPDQDHQRSILDTLSVQEDMEEKTKEKQLPTKGLGVDP